VETLVVTLVQMGMVVGGTLIALYFLLRAIRHDALNERAARAHEAEQAAGTT
jgi:hypothetical protein